MTLSKPISFAYPRDLLHLDLNLVASQYSLKSSGLFRSFEIIELVKSPPEEHKDYQLLSCLIAAANKSNPKFDHLKSGLSEKEIKLIECDDFKRFARTLKKAQSLSTRIKNSLRKLPLITEGALSKDAKLCLLKPDFWHEKLLKDHPCGQDISEFFIIWSKNNQLSCSFEDWLALKPSIVDLCPQVNYLDESRRHLYEVTVRDGKVIGHHGPLETDSFAHKKHENYAIYVISPELKFYIGPYKSGHFHHSSFLGGAPVIGAGEIKTDKEGTITHLSKDSGHYDPSDLHLEQTLAFLSSHGVDIASIRLF